MLSPSADSSLMPPRRRDKDYDVPTLVLASLLSVVVTGLISWFTFGHNVATKSELLDHVERGHPKQLINSVTQAAQIQQLQTSVAEIKESVSYIRTAVEQQPEKIANQIILRMDRERGVQRGP